MDRLNGEIIIKTGINWKTWGDTICFKLSSAGPNRTTVIVTSRPTIKTTIVDFGKNLENIIKITGFLTEKDQASSSSSVSASD
ncbi:MAG: hypothetical protein ISR96_08210 [Nitrospira sp.]|nr:hypothetical protein [bacterium]MBL7049481.1 hypothetical protein [Nitrospira sp.]